MATSIVWPYIVRSSGGLWTEQQAMEYAKTAGDLHRIGHELIHKNNPSLESLHQDISPNSETAYNEAKARYENSHAQFSHAQFWSQDAAEWIKWFGIACTLTGILGFYFFRTKSV
jgi:hypothetical protein